MVFSWYVTSFVSPYIVCCVLLHICAMGTVVLYLAHVSCHGHQFSMPHVVYYCLLLRHGHWSISMSFVCCTLHMISTYGYPALQGVCCVGCSLCFVLCPLLCYLHGMLHNVTWFVTLSISPRIQGKIGHGKIAYPGLKSYVTINSS